MSIKKRETRKMRRKVFLIGGFIVAFLCAVIFLFISAQDVHKDKLVTAPFQSGENTTPSPNKTEKWH